MKNSMRMIFIACLLAAAVTSETVKKCSEMCGFDALCSQDRLSFAMVAWYPPALKCINQNLCMHKCLNGGQQWRKLAPARKSDVLGHRLWLQMKRRDKMLNTRLGRDFLHDRETLNVTPSLLIHDFNMTSKFDYSMIQLLSEMLHSIRTVKSFPFPQHCRETIVHSRTDK